MHPSIAKARETIARVNEMQANGWMDGYHHAEQRSFVTHSASVENAGLRWRREQREAEEARADEKERESITHRTVQRLEQELNGLRSEVAQGLRAVGQLAKALRDRLDELGQDVDALQVKLTTVESHRTVDVARLEDLRKAVGDKAGSADVRFIVAPIQERLEMMRGDVDKLNLALKFFELKRIAE